MKLSKRKIRYRELLKRYSELSTLYRGAMAQGRQYEHELEKLRRDYASIRGKYMDLSREKSHGLKTWDGKPSAESERIAALEEEIGQLRRDYVAAVNVIRELGLAPQRNDNKNLR